MPEGKHSLPDGYDRLDGQITGPVLDSIVVHPRSHGRLHMPGEYRTDKRPSGHQVKVTSTDTENQGVYTGERLLGVPERYAVSYDVEPLGQPQLRRDHSHRPGGPSAGEYPRRVREERCSRAGRAHPPEPPARARVAASED